MKTETQGSETETPKRGVLTGLAMLGVGLTAAITSWAGWTGLAELCGFRGTLSLGDSLPTLHVSWLVAVSVDLYALVGFQMWLHGSRWVSDHTRNFARASTFAAIILGAAANVAYHVISAEKIRAEYLTEGLPMPPMAVVVIVSSLAPIFLGVVAHLDALMRRDLMKARQGETWEAQVKTETPARRLMGLALSRLEKTLGTPGETETETLPVKTRETETLKPESTRVEAPKINTPTVESVETKTPAPRAAKVSSLAERSATQTERLELIKAYRENWLALKGAVSYADIEKATGITGRETLKNLRAALVKEAKALTTTPQEAPTIAPDDARELVSAI